MNQQMIVPDCWRIREDGARLDSETMSSIEVRQVWILPDGTKETIIYRS